MTFLILSEVYLSHYFELYVPLLRTFSGVSLKTEGSSYIQVFHCIQILHHCTTLAVILFYLSVQIITYNDSCTAEDICAAASKLITFIDLAGHHKYMKTTIFGLTGYFPTAVMLVVGANTGMGEL